MSEQLSPSAAEVTDITMVGDRRGLYLPEHLAEPRGSNSGNIVNINNNPNINIGQQSINGSAPEGGPGTSSTPSTAEAPRTTAIPVEVIPSSPAAEAPGSPPVSPAETLPPSPEPTPEPAPPTTPEAPDEDGELITEGYPKTAEWTPLHGDEPHKVQVVGEYKNKLNGETMYKISSPNLEGMENHPIPASELNFDVESGGDSELKEQIKQLIEQLEEANKRIRKLGNEVARAKGEPLPHPDEEVDDTHENEEGLFKLERNVGGLRLLWEAKVGDTVNVKKDGEFEDDWKITKIEPGEDGTAMITASKEGEEDIVESSDKFIKWAVQAGLLEDDDEGPTPEPEPTDPAEGNETLLAPEDDSWVRVGDLAVYKRDGRTERFWRIDEQRVIERDGQKFVVLRNTHDLHTTQEVPYETYYKWHQEEFGNQGGEQGRMRAAWNRARNFMLWPAQRFDVWRRTRTEEVEDNRRSRAGLAGAAILLAGVGIGYAIDLVEDYFEAKHGVAKTGVGKALRDHQQATPDHTTFYNPELGNHGVAVEMPHGWHMHQAVPGGEHFLNSDNGDSLKISWDEQGNLSHATREALTAKGLELHQDQVDYINSVGREATHYMTEITEK